MKTVLIISLVSLLAACGPSVERQEIPQDVCVGKLQMVTDRHLRMTCDNGQVINYTSYKYPMTVK